MDIDDEATAISFPEHTVHVTETIHAAWDCQQCHTPPTDVLTPGHIFVEDETAAVAEVVLSGGQSPAGSYSAGSCSNLYCHGTGQSGGEGSVSSGDERTCTMCHGDGNSGASLSGEHAEHIRERLACDECHGDVVSGSTTVTAPTLHVNTSVDVALPDGMTRSGDTCTGTCHGERHDNRRW